MFRMFGTLVVCCGLFFLVIGQAAPARGESQVEAQDDGEAALALLSLLTNELRSDIEALAATTVHPRFIVAWYPTPSHLTVDGNIVAPEGWAICDGTNGTPDLRGVFIRGTDDIDEAGRGGGALEHTHGTTGRGGDTKRVDNGGDYRTSADDHRHSVSAASHMPPFLKMVYIMRIDPVPASLAEMGEQRRSQAGLPEVRTGLSDLAIAVDALAGVAVPSRSILVWVPTRADLNDEGEIDPPKGWFLADGRNGTPDLVARLIYGAESFADVGAVGGASTHTHALPASGAHRGVDRGDDHHVSDRGHSHEAQSATSLPPLVRLAYIMKGSMRTLAAGQEGAGGPAEVIARMTAAEATGLALGLRKRIEALREVSVVSGTVVAWNPTRENLDADGWLVPPSGWVVCDGANGTPDLRNRFVYGTNVFRNIGNSEDGSHSHNHNTTRGGFRRGVDDDPDDHHISGDGHRHSVPEASVLPPFVNMVYIMKR